VEYPLFWLQTHVDYTDRTSLTFKGILALEFLFGSILIVRTVLFTKKMAERYKLQAMAH
jgi:hypothetical protein